MIRKAILIIIANFLLSFVSFASDKTDSSHCENLVVSKPSFLYLLNNSFPVLDELKPSKKRIDIYAGQDKDYKVKKTIYKADQETSTSLRYSFYNEKLKPGECIYLAIPYHLRDKPILFVNLGHKQSYDDNTGYNSETKWDENPGLTTIQLNQNNNDGKSQWRYWNGLSSGDYGAKFAEPNNMELEGLYEWYKYGHKDIETNTVSKEPLYIDGARVCSIGKDPITLGSVVLKMAPTRSKEYKEINISKSNVMGDPLTAKNRNYGSRTDAVFLGGYKSKKINSDLELKDGHLEMKLKVGSKLNSFEISIGDLKSDGESGWARLESYILKSDGTRISLNSNENIPPEGVLVSSPEIDNYKIQDGDKLIVESRRDESFVTGIRVGYN